MLLLSLLFACTSEKPDDTASTSPSIEIIAPTATDSIGLGPFMVSVVVENFALTAPAKHNEGEPEGYIRVSVDGAEVLTTGETSFELTAEDYGPATITTELYYTDGDPLEPPVSDEVTIEVG